MKWLAILGISLCVGGLTTGCGGGGGSSSSAETASAEPGPEVKIPAGDPPKHLVVKVLKKGTGRVARADDEITLQYVGKRWNGEGYSNSWTYQQAPSFHFGEHRLAPGLEKALIGMKAGTRSEIIVPPKLIHYANEETTAEDLRPLNTLVFVVGLLAVK